MKATIAVILAAVLVSGASGAAAPPTKTPGELVVALSMPAPGFQVGAVRGRDVVLAKGLEIDLARALARRLGIPRVRFVNERLFSTLLRPGMLRGMSAITAPMVSRSFSAGICTISFMGPL